MQKQSYFLDIITLCGYFLMSEKIHLYTSAVSVKSDIPSNEAAAISFVQNPGLMLRAD